MNIWGKGGLYDGKYERHSVDRDVKFFVGWSLMDELFMKIESHTYREVGIFAFKLAARITEALQSTREMFIIDRDFILVRNFPILKRWKAVDKIIICERCKTKNSKFEVTCNSCGANLLHSGKRKFVTERVDHKRLPFFVKTDEALSSEMLAVLRGKQSGLLFPSPYTGNPYTRSWAYNIIKDYGSVAGLDNLYNHWFRAQRLMQLGYEYKFNREELKAFSGIIKDETLDKYTKQIQQYTDKLGLQLSPEQMQRLLMN